MPPRTPPFDLDGEEEDVLPLSSEAALALLSILPFPVLSMDADGFLIGGNPAARTRLGCTWGPWGEERDSDYYVDPDDTLRVREALVEDKQGQGCRFDLDMRDKAGKPLPSRLYGVAVRNLDGDMVSTVVLLQDLGTENKLQEKLEEATRRAIEAEQRMGDQAQGRKLAHELNQPLTVAMGLLEMISTGPDLPEPVTRRLEKIQEQLDRIAFIIRRFREETWPRENRS
ncbi:MAG: hypothetical protein JXB39_08630 [Deltaproteobacteria bacterium]|nr:hypothetical protein [Deltaproteobacteria bacterium]